MLISGCEGKRDLGDKGSDCYEKLSEDERKLIDRIISDMQHEREKDSLAFNVNTVSYEYYNTAVDLKTATVEPISPDYAALLKENYRIKREQIEALRTDMRHGDVGGGVSRPRDADYVWVSIDEFAPFFSKLIQYQSEKRTATGMKIIFGSYPYDPVRDAELNIDGTRRNLDSLSGRSTVYFQGTFDSTNLRHQYFVTRHKDIPSLSIPIPVPIARGPGPGSIMNHGTLCPDSCTP